MLLSTVAAAGDIHVERLQSGIAAAVDNMCSTTRRVKHPDFTYQESCFEARRFQEALKESGRRLSPAEEDPWEALEGEALKRHPDPLGALQRGEVPAVVLRRFVPEAELSHMLSRMAQMVIRIFACRFPVTIDAVTARTVKGSRAHRIHTNDSYCEQLNKHTVFASLSWPHWCTLLANAATDCVGSGGDGSLRPECKALSERHPVFERCLYDYGKKRKILQKNFVKDKIVKAAAHEFGQKLYGNLYKGAKKKFMRGARSINALHGLLGHGCGTDRFCSPKHAMLAGIAELAGPHRPTRQAEEDPGSHHSPGTVRAMTHGWATPLHMDSKHSNAWAALRTELCGDNVTLSMGTEPAAVMRYQALTRHNFAASAIFTMHAPNRSLNPFDLNIFRTRYPALMRNCSVRTIDAYGIGARFDRNTVPPHVLARPIQLRADPGDLFLFNSEFLHDTPRILGRGSRTVFNSFAGFSSSSDPHVEVYA